MGMRERALLYDGQLTVASAPGQGAILTVCLQGTAWNAKARLEREAAKTRETREERKTRRAGPRWPAPV